MSKKNEPKKDKIKMSVRDNRLFQSITGQRKIEEQEEQNDIEMGARRKTPTKRSTSAIKRDRGTDEFYTEEMKKIKKSKDRVKKMMKKKTESDQGAWMNNGPVRTLFKCGKWEKYSPYIAKIQNYDNFDPPNLPPLQRLYKGQEHRDRTVRCCACEQVVPSTENLFEITANIYCHLECSKKFLSKPF